MNIFMNQTGFLPNAPKQAIHRCSENRPFVIYDAATNSPCYHGMTQYHGYDDISGIEAAVADFSDFTTPGEYYMVIQQNPEKGSSDWSYPFTIRKGLYHSLSNDLLKALYYQRCGCGLTPKHAGSFSHAACHTAPASLYEAPAIHLDVSGGWHDAGDYGRYVTPAAVTVSHLLYAYELFPEKFQSQINLPESGQPMSGNQPASEVNSDQIAAPDILHEARYELNWLLKMQRQEDGGVYHKVTTSHHAPFVMPEADQAPLIVYPVSSMATAMFSAVMAQAARVYAAFDPAFAETALTASRHAFDWLLTHPEFLPFRNPEDCKTGEYRHFGDADHRMWAAAELLRTLSDRTEKTSDAISDSTESTTKTETYLHVLQHFMAQPEVNKTSFGWSETGGLAMLSIIFDPKKSCGDALTEQARQLLLQDAEKKLAMLSITPFQVPMEVREYAWGSNMTVMTRGMLFAIAHMLTGDISYIHGAHACLDYLLGKNSAGYSYVSGYGKKSMRYPHNRPTVADGLEAIMPGWVAGGANCRHRDPAADEAILHLENQAPMACYADNWLCYSLNEITIYWNSPALFVAAYLDI